VGASKIMRKQMARAAGDLVDYFVKSAQDGRIEPMDFGKFFEALRPTGIEAVRVIFGREMERALRELLESGKIAKLPAARTKRRAKKK
jgi:hypothetical protein